MISAQTLCVCREGKPLRTFPDPHGSLALGVVMLLAFRGCPICWTIGLLEIARRQWRRR
jgi:hypothetical protein